MTGNDLLKKVKAHAKSHNKKYKLKKNRGKGSHQTVYLEHNKAVIPNPKNELKDGTLRNICRALSLDAHDL